jgi:SAM-dependent methyltransferase
MSEDQSTGATTAADWAAANGLRWGKVADRVEAQLEPVADILFEYTDLRPGERVLDVGCGRGVTTRRAAIDVDPGGSVTGVDVAENLLDDAREIPAAGVPIAWRLGDAQRDVLAPDHHDAIISRFGVMFFDDPVAAFANLAHTTRPDGRLAIAVWQPRDRSEIFHRPLELAVDAARGVGFAIDDSDSGGGAFSFGDEKYVDETLERAGWADVAIHPREVEMYYCGPGTVAEITEAGMSFGPLFRALADAPAEASNAVRAALEAEFGARHDGVGVKMQGAIAIVTARCPAPD